MKRSIALIPILILALVSFITKASYYIPARVALQTTSGRVLIPLYSDPPNNDWNTVISANSSKNIDIIANPADGVGTSKNSNYTTGITNFKQNGVGVYGYVFTGFGTRSLSVVEAEIDNWQAWYNVDGIFVDEVSDTTSGLSYYTTLYNYIHNKGMKVVLNFGTNTIQEYASIGDILCIYEDSSISIPFASWQSNYPASKFCALRFGTDINGMMNFINEGFSKNIGNMFITDDSGINPWDTLPNYLPEEASLLAGTSATDTPIPTSTTVIPSPTATFVAPVGWVCSEDANLQYCYQIK